MGAAFAANRAVPADFPTVAGESSEEHFGAWQVCDEFATWLYGVCLTARTECKMAGVEGDILALAKQTAADAGWGTEDELRWAINRVATLFSWTVPTNFQP